MAEPTVQALAQAGRSSPRHEAAATYGDPRSWPARFRRRRFELLRPLIERIIAERGVCRIADIGGTQYYWQIFGGYVDSRPLEIELINLAPVETSGPRFQSRIGNATDLGDLEDDAYDLVHSNSVIEHVGGWDAMTRMAANVRRLAPVYYVQTPNFWFPYEPHYRVPLFHWLPEQVRCRLAMRFDLGFGTRQDSVDAAMRGVQSAVLLDRLQMRALFPDAHLVDERVLGLAKSLIALRTER